MNIDNISIISVDSTPKEGYEEYEAEDIRADFKKRLPYSQHNSQRRGQENQSEPKENLEQDARQMSQKGDEDAGDSSEKRIDIKEKTPEKDGYSMLRDSSRAVVISVGIIAACILCSVPSTTIPRTNSILYQKWWMEMILTAANVLFLDAASRLLNLAVWTKERSIKSVKVLLKVFFLAYIIPYLLFYVSSYIVWSVHFGFNHPMPYLGLVILPIQMAGAAELWILLPSEALGKQQFRRKLKMYMAYCAWTWVMTVQNEILSYCFANFSTDLQFLVAFMIATCREFDFFIRSSLIDKMMGVQDESATALLTITINCSYGSFVARRLEGASLATICCIVAIDFFIHLKNTYRVINEHRRVNIEEEENASLRRARYITQLVVSELTEGFIPITYGTCMVLAIYGPNSRILANVGSIYWGEVIEDIGSLLFSMGILFVFDLLSVLVTSVVLWKVASINMFQEFRDGIDKYCLFLMIKLGTQFASYFALSDINLGMDSTGNFDWITPEGRRSLIYNSTDLTDEEKMTLLTDTNLI